MRFDDRLETALRQADENVIGMSAKWQQLVDLLAQDPTQFPVDNVAAGLMQVRALLPKIPLVTRVDCVKALSGRLKSAPLVLLLAGDAPSVASAAIAGAKLSDGQWAGIVAELPTRARGFLRNRADLGPMTLRALQVWSAADFALPIPSQADANQTSTADDLPAPNSTQIRDIVERIERLRRDRQAQEPLPHLPESTEPRTPVTPITEIRFETDEVGVVTWVEGAPRGAIVGVDIADPAFDDGPGPDAYGASAFRQRMPLENARMRLCGAPAIEGDWRINATPFFDQVSGRFSGYRGIMRRPNMAESAEMQQERTAHGEQLQQLVHELRTPLGAIIGFSEIIEQQMFGPVTHDYRGLARNILEDAERLLAGFDDLATAAKIDSGNFAPEPGITDCDWLAVRMADRLRDLSDLLHVTLNLAHAHPVRPFAIGNELAERMFSRLLSAVIIGCEADEELNGRFRTEPGRAATNSFVLTLPQKLRSLSETELFSSGTNNGQASDEAPLLGLGFSLRLVRSLARNAGGDLRFYNDALILTLPAVQDSRSRYSGEESD